MEQTKPRIKALLLDVDGVLVHTDYFTVYLERDYGISQDVTLPFFKNEFQACLRGKMDLREALSGYVDEWGWKGTVDEMLGYWFEVENKPDREIIEYIQKLRRSGVMAYVATNQEAYRVEYLRQDMRFGELFDGVLRELSELGAELKPHEILFWDNDKGNVENARAVGLQAQLYTDIDAFKSTIVALI